jgi:hypothetical protein
MFVALMAMNAMMPVTNGMHYASSSTTPWQSSLLSIRDDSLISMLRVIHLRQQLKNHSQSASDMRTVVDDLNLSLGFGLIIGHFIFFLYLPHFPIFNNEKIN